MRKLLHAFSLLILCTLAQQTPLFGQYQAVEFDGTQEPIAAPRPPRYDSLLLQKNFDRIQSIIQGITSYHDSSAIQVLSRMGWREMAIVTDWTASMHAHDALLIRWHLAQMAQGQVRHLSFFNDGDGQYDDEKQIGQTGGIYHASGLDSAAIWQAMEATTLGGNGGDHRENVVEALLDGIAACPECQEIVLVADNNAPIRDLDLLPGIDRPIRVVLVGVYKDGILTDYLNLAYHTGGSLHTRTLDLIDFESGLQHGIISIGEHRYLLDQGFFVKYKERE